MTRLNDTAAASFVSHGIRACTDVTGFGLLGHLHRLTRASGVAAEVDAPSVPLFDGVLSLAEDGYVPGGTKRNHDAIEVNIDFAEASELSRFVLCDAQTSGGLLGVCPPDRVDGLLADLGGELACAVIGRVTDGEAGRIVVAGDVA
jgi:selenide,water dikinase